MESGRALKLSVAFAVLSLAREARARTHHTTTTHTVTRCYNEQDQLIKCPSGPMPQWLAAVIGVGSVVGAAILALLTWWAIRRWKRAKAARRGLDSSKSTLPTYAPVYDQSTSTTVVDDVVYVPVPEKGGDSGYSPTYMDPSVESGSDSQSMTCHGVKTRNAPRWPWARSQGDSRY